MEEEIVLSKNQYKQMNHLYSKVAENDTLTVRKDQSADLYFNLVKHHF